MIKVRKDKDTVMILKQSEGKRAQLITLTHKEVEELKRELNGK